MKLEVTDMEKGLKKMRVVTPDREKLAERILKEEAGWDGEFPIPVAYYGGAERCDMKDLSILHADGDSQCFWLKTASSALVLFLKGHNLVTEPSILRKRAAYNG